MPKILFGNNATARLTAPVGSGDTVINVDSTAGFPVPAAGQIFKVTLEDHQAGLIEIMHCTAINALQLLVDRAQEGTAALEFPDILNTIVQNRNTRETMQSLAQLDPANPAVYPEFLQQQADGSITGNIYNFINDVDPVIAGSPVFEGCLWYQPSNQASFIRIGTDWKQFGTASALAPPYLGAHPAPLTERPDGSPLQAGDFYLDTTDNLLYFWTGILWIPMTPGAKRLETSYWFTLAVPSTSLQGVDDFGNTLEIGPEVLSVDVWQDGLKLKPVTDYSVQDSFTVLLVALAPAGAVMEVRTNAGDVLPIGTTVVIDDIGPQFDGVDTDFTLFTGGSPLGATNAESLLIHLDDVIQQPGLDYTWTAGVITFTVAPTAGQTFFGRQGIGVGSVSLGIIPYDFGIFFDGIPAISEDIFEFLAVREFYLPQNLVGSLSSSGVAATAQFDVDIQRNGGSIGTIRWAAAGTVPTFIFAADVNFAVGDLLSLIAPAVVDATIADLRITLAATLGSI